MASEGSAIKKFLQGRWIGHPLHAAIVHVPIGAWPASLAFDVLSRLNLGGNAMVRTSFACIAAGLVVTLAAVPTGLADWWDIRREKPAHKLGIYHMAVMAISAVLFSVNLILRWNDVAVATQVTATQLALSAFATAVMLVGMWLGQRLAYEHGIGVARVSKKRWRKYAEAAGVNVPEGS